MKIFGRKISNWWFLLIPPLLILVSPLLMMLFFMGNNFAGAIFGPPAIWNRPWHIPPYTDLTGKYSESERYLGHASNLPQASLMLNSDGSMVAANLPYELGETSCTLSGKGKWSGPSGPIEDQKIDLVLTSDGSSGSCESGSYSFLEIAGHSRPYSLYWMIGDPDSGTGIWLRKK
jgi:hypothetical protein